MNSNKNHKKHPSLQRPQKGNYHKLEYSIYGTTCSEIEAFYNNLKNHFKPKYKFTYIDADHSDSVKNTLFQIGKKQYGQDHIISTNSFDDKFNIQLSQAVFINGNHYPGKKQIIIIDPKKKDSLERRVDQLDQIDFIILPDESTAIFDIVKAKMHDTTKVFCNNELDQVFSYLEEEITAAIPPIKALILAGGKSTRMQEDKSKLKYHGEISQEEYLANMCKDLGLETYISKSSSETETAINNINVIKDRYIDMGPFGAILSAFMYDPDSAWLVLACDLPFVSKSSIKRLVDERAIVNYATAYRVEENPFPEPLIAIYEPAIYKRMLGFLSLGYACPRKVLINSEVKHVILEDEQVAFNANTPNDKAAVLDQLNPKH